MRAYQLDYRAKNKQRVLERDRAYYAEHREASNSARQARYAANAEHERTSARLRYELNAVERRAAQVEWGRRNKPLRQAAHARRKALKRAATAFEVSARDWTRLCNRFNNCCAYCGERKPLTQDHVVAIVRGGSHSIGNLLPSCVSCNASKGSKLLIEWRLWLSKK